VRLGLRRWLTSAEGIDAAGDLMEVAQQDRVPAVLARHGANYALEVGQRTLESRKDFAASAHKD